MQFSAWPHAERISSAQKISESAAAAAWQCRMALATTNRLLHMTNKCPQSEDRH